MTEKLEQLMADPEGRRAFEEELLIGDVTDTVEALLRSLRISQRELARRLDISDGRVSQILAGTGNLTLRSLAAVAWALGMRFELQPKPMSNRVGTPAQNDPQAPAWLHRLGGTARIQFDPALRVPEQGPAAGNTVHVDSSRNAFAADQASVAA
jgi:transcriptional regulator with XRE-family HTH domain